MRVAIFLLVLLPFMGCATEQPPPLTRIPPGCYEQNVHCLHCGADYTRVSPQPGPSTTEWCINDGQICQVGLDLIVEGAYLVNTDGTVKDPLAAENLEKRVKKHCEECEGCKMAFFTPETWEAEKRK